MATPLELVSAIPACRAGSADEVREHLLAYWQAGARVFVLRIASLDRPTDQLELLAEQVLPAVARW